jgi:hypothetical protein
MMSVSTFPPLQKNGHIKQLGERLDGIGKVVRGAGLPERMEAAAA